MSVNLWKQDFVLDIEKIDDQHKRFFELCAELTQLSDSCKDGCVSRNELIRAVFELRLYAFHHFHTEETLMVKYGYPRCLQHFREHDAYLKRLREVVGEVESLPGEKAPQADQSLRDLANKLSEWAVFWWSEHILSHDQQYAGHIKKVKKRKE